MVASGDNIKAPSGAFFCMYSFNHKTINPKEVKMFQLKTEEVQVIVNFLSANLTIAQTQIAEQVVKMITANPVKEDESKEEQ